MAAPTGTKGTTGKREPAWPVTVGLYGALFLFGAVQGLIGSFQYSRAAGAVPVAALICCAAILATCLLASWATQITVDAPFFALSNQIRREALGVEYYTLLDGRPGPTGPGGRETGLFAQ